MGKISEYIIELTETFGELLDRHGNYEAAIDDMRDLLTPDEFEFFSAHLDIIEDNLDFTDGIEMEELDGGENWKPRFAGDSIKRDPTTEETGSEELDERWGDDDPYGNDDYKRKFKEREMEHELGHEDEDERRRQRREELDEDENEEMTDYMRRRMGDYSDDERFERTGETDYMKRRREMDGGSELKGGKVNFDPADEFDEDDIYQQPIEGSEDDWIYDTPESHAERMRKRKEMLAKPYPIGSGGVDKVFDDKGRRIEESSDVDEGIKGDLLRKFGGRRIRDRMGFGKGNRAGYNPDDEIYMDLDDDDQEDVITTYGSQDTPAGETPMSFKPSKPRDIERKHGRDKWGNDPRDFGKSLKKESLKMPSITDFKE